MNASELSTPDLFAPLSGGDRAEVARLADEVTIAPGERLISQGKFGTEFFVIADGEAVVHRDGSHVGYVGLGDFFGESALIGDVEHNASVTATSWMRVVVLTDRGFRLPSRISPPAAQEIRAACRARDCPLGDSGSAAA
jgi:CRP-like cAMP-binding protein